MGRVTPADTAPDPVPNISPVITPLPPARVMTGKLTPLTDVTVVAVGDEDVMLFDPVVITFSGDGDSEPFGCDGRGTATGVGAWTSPPSSALTLVSPVTAPTAPSALTTPVLGLVMADALTANDVNISPLASTRSGLRTAGDRVDAEER